MECKLTLEGSSGYGLPFSCDPTCRLWRGFALDGVAFGEIRQQVYGTGDIKKIRIGVDIGGEPWIAVTHGRLCRAQRNASFTKVRAECGPQAVYIGNPASSGTGMRFTIANNTTITLQWKTNYYIAVGVQGQ